MSPSLRDEIQQTRPFASALEEALLNLIRTAHLVQEGAEQLFRQFGVTAAQYNVLRILRGARPEGLGRNEIRDRLLSRMPDVTRLLDRMEEAGLVRRERDPDDRRCVPTYITDRGLGVLDALDEPTRLERERSFGHLNPEQLRQLTELLTLVRHPSHPRAP